MHSACHTKLPAHTALHVYTCYHWPLHRHNSAIFTYTHTHCRALQLPLACHYYTQGYITHTHNGHYIIFHYTVITFIKANTTCHTCFHIHYSHYINNIVSHCHTLHCHVLLATPRHAGHTLILLHTLILIYIVTGNV
jgi:hypothetical protein